MGQSQETQVVRSANIGSLMPNSQRFSRILAFPFFVVSMPGCTHRASQRTLVHARQHVVAARNNGQNLWHVHRNLLKYGSVSTAGSDANLWFAFRGCCTCVIIVVLRHIQVLLCPVRLNLEEGASKLAPHVGVIPGCSFVYRL